MLSDLIVARAYLHTDHVDLARAGEIDCAWHALIRRINTAFTNASQRMATWVR